MFRLERPKKLCLQCLQFESANIVKKSFVGGAFHRLKAISVAGNKKSSFLIRRLKNDLTHQSKLSLFGDKVTAPVNAICQLYHSGFLL
ncbi:MAG: hypothetical protein RL015_1669 [Verrucomicrobiota bacterium]|jgi:hypothetical protein